jgi:hypothetical protein
MNTGAGMHDLVIARHNESLDWVLEVAAEYRVHIYDKGGPPVSSQLRDRAETYVPLRNAGRESDSYLTHMIEYGPGAGEFTVFTQGDPFEHSPDFLRLLAGHATWPDVQTLSWCWKESIAHPPPTLLAPERSIVPGLRVREELFSLSTFHPVEWVDVGAGRIGQEYRSLHRLPEGANIGAHFLDMCDLPDAAELAARHLVGRHAYGALFAVRNHLIEKLPTRALLRLRQAALGPDVHGYFCERLWLHIFGEAFLLPVRSPG